MFRRLADFASGAVGGRSSSSSHEHQVQQLQAMGFDASQARIALQQTDGNVDRAAELLLSGTMSTANTRTSPPAVVDLAGDTTTSNDDAIQNAIQESLYSEEDRLFRQAQEASVEAHHRHRSAAGNRAAEAAARRAAESASRKTKNTKATTKKQTTKPKTTTTAQSKPAATTTKNTTTPATLSNPMKVTKTKKVGVSHAHPNVKLPSQFKDKTKEEQVLRCADRLKSYPLAVDTLYRALTALQKDPSNEKYRKIDKTTPGYKRSLENVPGGEALLLAMNFHSRGAYSLVLERQWADQALLYLGISALEGAKQSSEYIEAKAKLAFVKEVKQLSSDSSEAEAVRRAEYMAKCPSEPSGGSGALMQVVIVEDTFRRKFDGDDVLRDVLNWIGGHGSVIPEKILSREWCLVDINRYPIAPIDCELNIDKTLQFIGCWPSGRLELRASSEAWKEEGNKGQVLMGSSRGLGAAPTEAMH